MEEGSLRNLFWEPEEEGLEVDSSGFWTSELAVEPLSFSDSNREPPEAASPAGPVAFRVTLAPDEGANATLFAYSVWNGSRMLASYLHANPGLVEGRAVLEFGAACSLPSLVALHHGASMVTITDYPAPPVLEAITRTVHDDKNREVLGGGLDGRVAVVGHLWGTDVAPLMALLPRETKGYALVIASECLWLHAQHHSLLCSISGCLSPGGMCLVSFAHHVPGCEAKDLGFFDRAAREFGLEVRRVGSASYPHMFKAGASVTQHLYAMTKPNDVE